jgi:hypothetical protein
MSAVVLLIMLLGLGIPGSNADLSALASGLPPGDEFLSIIFFFFFFLSILIRLLLSLIVLRVLLSQNSFYFFFCQ